MDNSKFKVLLVDDHEIVRIGLRLLLDSWSEVDLVGECTDGSEVEKLVTETDPDVILMDIAMPKMNGIEASQQIRTFNEKVRIIMLTSQSNVLDVKAALAAGANGYCLKDVDDDRLKRAILSVLDGDIWLDARVSDELLRSNAETSNDSQLKKQDEPDYPYEALSNREHEVLKLMVEGMTNKEIGEQLFISRDTVKTHIKHLMEKLAARDRTHAAVKAIKHNLI